MGSASDVGLCSAAEGQTGVRGCLAYHRGRETGAEHRCMGTGFAPSEEREIGAWDGSGTEVCGWEEIYEGPTESEEEFGFGDGDGEEGEGREKRREERGAKTELGDE